MSGVLVSTSASTANTNADDIVVGSGSANAGLTINHGTNTGALYFQNGSSNTYGGAENDLVCSVPLLGINVPVA